ncbi:MAG: efflux RND transporter permease subunit [Deltaproteobacteria bacterium]|nr:efflux RND transporter permease subunit [Deltaproteobacteria bacterium]MBK8718833.1 efflux RND transporter permease subunit [Deltaproteobacteria bacterium]MBP7286551.1 efflux RND transporter permease subunit [Nannocystaceae bacterium]
MTLSELGVRRPVLAVVTAIALLVFGAVALALLGVREYPAVDPPVVTVRTTYAGAAAQTVDTTITEPIEQALGGVAGIRTISSSSRDGISDIRVEFELDYDIAEGANDVRDKVGLARRNLPPDVDPPVVEKADADASPIIFITLSSESASILAINEVADTLVRERVQTIPGVASVRIFGEQRWAMRLRLDPVAMAGHGVVPADIRDAFARESVDLPAGRTEGTQTELGLRAAQLLSTPEEFGRLVLREQNGRQIVLGDIGRAELGAQNPRTGLRELGTPMVGVAIVPQPNSNAIAIADELYQRLDTIREAVPPGIEVDIGYDFTTYVRKSVREVQETLLTAFGLVALVILLFLRDWRATLIPVLAIPISIVPTFFVMYALGFTINILSLVALVLAIGVVCDDAIVVLENVYSRIERGAAPEQAALEGAREVYFAVLATTVALVAVFVPIVFVGGLTGRLLREFGIVVAAAVVISAFVALSLSPMMCHRLLRSPRADARPGLLHRVMEPLLSMATRSYAWTLAGFLRVRVVAPTLLVVFGAATIALWQALPQELAPLEDRSNIRVTTLAPEGANFAYNAAALDRLATTLVDQVPEIRRTFSIVGRQGAAANVGLQNIYLVEPEERSRSQAEIFADVARIGGDADELRVLPSQPPTIGARFSGLQLQYALQAPTPEELLEVLPQVLERAAARPELRFVDADLKLARPELRIEVDRARAADLGVAVRDVADALQLAFGERRIGYFLQRGRQYDVISELDRSAADEPSDVDDLHVRTASGELVPLSAVTRRAEGIAPSAVYRFDRSVSATLSAGLAPGYTLGDGIHALDEVTAELLPSGFRTALVGEARDFSDSASSLLFTFGLAVLLAYLVLAAQFDSFIDPLIVMMTVPLSLVGGLGALAVSGGSINVFSQIGLIMLVGLVTKNGILIVEFANHHKARGLAPELAVREAAAARFRPVLMTALSTVLGVAPIALTLGASTGSRQSLGIAVIGGMAVGTFLTLYVVPAMYSLFSRPRRPAAIVDAGASADSLTDRP